METSRHKFMQFNRFCKDCKYKEKDETEKPCKKCLLSELDDSTRKPLYFSHKNHSVL